jgi:hypothetical protein
MPGVKDRIFSTERAHHVGFQNSGDASRGKHRPPPKDWEHHWASQKPPGTQTISGCVFNIRAEKNLHLEFQIQPSS